MITDNDIREIIVKDELSDSEICEVLERYIHDKKGVNIKVNRPTNLIALQLMDHMYNVALGYYANKLNNGSKDK